VTLFDQVDCLKGFGAKKIIRTLSIIQGLWADGCLHFFMIMWGRGRAEEIPQLYLRAAAGMGEKP
jgi:hypothetical protein